MPTASFWTTGRDAEFDLDEPRRNKPTLAIEIDTNTMAFLTADWGCDADMHLGRAWTEICQCYNRICLASRYIRGLPRMDVRIRRVARGTDRTRSGEVSTDSELEMLISERLLGQGVLGPQSAVCFKRYLKRQCFDRLRARNAHILTAHEVSDPSAFTNCFSRFGNYKSLA